MLSSIVATYFTFLPVVVFKIYEFDEMEHR